MATPKIGNIERLPFDQTDVGAEGRAMQQFGANLKNAGGVLKQIHLEEVQKDNKLFEGEVESRAKEAMHKYLVDADKNPNLYGEEPSAQAFEQIYSELEPRNEEQALYLQQHMKASRSEFEGKMYMGRKDQEHKNMLNKIDSHTNGVIKDYMRTGDQAAFLANVNDMVSPIRDIEARQKKYKSIVDPVAVLALTGPSTVPDRESPFYKALTDASDIKTVETAWRSAKKQGNTRVYKESTRILSKSVSQHEPLDADTYTELLAMKPLVEEGMFGWTEAQSADFLMKLETAGVVRDIYYGKKNDDGTSVVGLETQVDNFVSNYMERSRINGSFDRDDLEKEIQREHARIRRSRPDTFTSYGANYIGVANNLMSKVKDRILIAEGDDDLVAQYDEVAATYKQQIENATNKLAQTSLNQNADPTQLSIDSDMVRMSEANYKNYMREAWDMTPYSTREKQALANTFKTGSPEDIQAAVMDLAQGTTNYNRDIQLLFKDDFSSTFVTGVQLLANYREKPEQAARMAGLISLMANDQTGTSSFAATRSVAKSLANNPAITSKIGSFTRTSGQVDQVGLKEDVLLLMMHMDPEFEKSAEIIENTAENATDRDIKLAEAAQKSFNKSMDALGNTYDQGRGRFVFQPHTPTDLYNKDNPFLGPVLSKAMEGVNNPETQTAIERGLAVRGAWMLSEVVFSNTELQEYLGLTSIHKSQRTPEQEAQVEAFYEEYGDLLNVQLYKGEDFATSMLTRPPEDIMDRLDDMFVFEVDTSGQWVLGQEQENGAVTPSVKGGEEIKVTWQEVASWGDRLGRKVTPSIGVREGMSFTGGFSPTAMASAGMSEMLFGEGGILSGIGIITPDRKLSTFGNVFTESVQNLDEPQTPVSHEQFSEAVYSHFGNNRAYLQNTLRSSSQYDISLDEIKDKVILAPIKDSSLIVDKTALQDDNGQSITLAKVSDYVAIYDKQTRTNTGFITYLDGGDIESSYRLWDEYERHGTFYPQGTINPNNLWRTKQFDRGHMVESSMAFINGVRQAKVLGLEGKELEEHMNKVTPQLIKDTYFGGNITAEDQHFNRFFKRNFTENTRAVFALLGFKGAVMQGYLPAEESDIRGVPNPSTYYSYVVAEIDGKMQPVSAYIADQSAAFPMAQHQVFNRYTPQGSVVEDQEQDLPHIQKTLERYVGDLDELMYLDKASDSVLKPE